MHMKKGIKELAKRTLALALTVTAIWTLQPAEVHAVNASGNIAQGVDVSKHNGSVNWSQVAASGMKFAFIKAGSTNSGVDPNFDANIKGAAAAGLKTGVYVYSYATTPEAAQNEANLVLQWISNYTVNYPVVFDQSAGNFDEIYVSGGRVGLTLKVPLKDLLDVTQGKLAPITME